ncbi:MAG: hypothetical protein H0U54_01385 [Acidobacteria bacterium]|nr:hypothetical protein [Acidobacteriota bacterium]
MKRYRYLSVWLCLLTLLTAATAQAQSYRLSSLAEQLRTQANDLAERSYTDYSNSSFSNRGDVEALYLVQQFSASANVFQRMLRDNRRESELRDAAAILSDLARRAGGNYSRRNGWNDVQRTLDDILRELNVPGSPGRGGGGGGRDNDGGGGGRTSGRVRWRGTVDDDVHLVIRDNQIEIRTIGGSEYNNATYNFTSPLPSRRVNVSAAKLKGRGEVRVLQQPSRDNDFTAVVQIRDPSGGAKEYEIEVTW